MTQLTDFLNPEKLFSRDNPFLQAAEKTHRLVFQTLDKTARVQLAFTEDLLDMNRERFDSLYGRQSMTELFTAQQNLASELGKRTARYAGDLQEVAGTMQAALTDAANELGASTPRKTSGAKSKKAA